MIVVNYPNNPTGACATKDIFKKLVNIAHEHSILVINDAAYSVLTSDENKLSIFNVDGALDVALELHSMSKGFNMTGWRIGWVCGNPYLVEAYAHVKDQSDSGQFLAIQKASVHTLDQGLFLPERNWAKYSQRMEKIVPILQGCGFDVVPAKAGFFLYTRIPTSATFNGETTQFRLAEEVATWMIQELGIVVVPWDDVEPAIRISMTFSNDQLDEHTMIELFRERMESVKFTFGHR